jgi:hypothetical protein
MTTLPGGPADKLGNRYEKLWAIAELLNMLMGLSDAIRIEDPSVQKAEFVVSKKGFREYHQTKRGNQSGKWSLAALAAKDVALIQAIGTILSGNGDRFVFASGSAAHELGELCEATTQAASLDEFRTNFLPATERRERFDKLCGYWACDEATACERLRRIEVRTIGDLALEQMVRWGIQALFLADPVDVLAWRTPSRFGTRARTCASSCWMAPASCATCCGARWTRRRSARRSTSCSTSGSAGEAHASRAGRVRRGAGEGGDGALAHRPA